MGFPNKQGHRQFHKPFFFADGCTDGCTDGCIRFVPHFPSLGPSHSSMRQRPWRKYLAEVDEEGESRQSFAVQGRTLSQGSAKAQWGIHEPWAMPKLWIIGLPTPKSPIRIVENWENSLFWKQEAHNLESLQSHSNLDNSCNPRLTSIFAIYNVASGKLTNRRWCPRLWCCGHCPVRDRRDQ